MNYYISASIMGFLLLAGASLNISPSATWITCYIIMFLTIKGKNPLDPRIWLFFAWGVIFTNLFSGVRYVPPIDFLFPILYTILVISCFFIGYSINKRIICKYAQTRVKTFLLKPLSTKKQKFINISALFCLIGTIGVLYDLFINLGVSFDGGDRRADFIENFNRLSFLTTIGMLMIGGCYMPIVSIYFQGSKINKYWGALSFLCLGLYSIAVGGKQGIFLVGLFLIAMVTISRKYKVKVHIPWLVKSILGSIIVFFFLYITALSSERHGHIDTGEALTNSTEFSVEFVNGVGQYIPSSLQNTFAEFFGYYGDQLGCFCERWNIDNYPDKFSFIEFPPRILEPFVWIKRQVEKVFPIYNEIFPPKDKNLILRIANQSSGYYGLANWQTTVRQGIDLFGFLGQLIIVLLHGYYSKEIFVRFHNSPSFSLLHACILNCIFLVYTTMMNLIGETSVLVYLILIIYLFYQERKMLIAYKNG